MALAQLGMIRRMTGKLSHLTHSKDMAPQPDPQMPQNIIHRGSMSTERTSMSEWSKRGDSIDSADPSLVIQPQQVLKQKGTYCLTDFIIQRTLGTGSFGRVHLGSFTPLGYQSIGCANKLVVRSKHNLRFYAIKVLNKERIVKMKQIEHTNNEQRMLAAVQHPFIINLWGTFQDSSNLYMVMDFVPGGELFTLLRRSNVCPSRHVHSFTY